MQGSSALEVVALTQKGPSPSARFRINQNIPHLAELGIWVRGYAPFLSTYSRLPGRLGKVRERYLFPVAIGKALLVAAGRVPGTIASYKADLTWINRSYVPGLEQMVRFVKGPRVLDVDDSVWLSTIFGQGAAAKFARQMDAVIAGNSYVADWYSQYCKNVHVVPDGIDTERFRPAAKPKESKTDGFVVGWTGTSVNFHELYRIEPALARFLKDHADAKLCIISNERPKFKQIPPAQLIYKRWAAATEATDLNDFDVGIMPLQETEWTRGKNSNKMLCYMASGLPVVVSLVGTNREILQMGEIGLAADAIDDWYGCLNLLFCDRNARLEMGNRGRQIIERNFSIRMVCGQLAKIFRTLAN